MSDGVHLLVPFAAGQSPEARRALQDLRLPHLERLLARMEPVRSDEGDLHSLSMPHERALAREYGLEATDGLIPWAAWQLEQAGRDTHLAAWAWITPCHWRVGRDHVAMAHPQELHLEERESTQFMAAMQPYFESDDIRLEYDAPTLWLARGEIFRQLPSASLDRVVGRVIDEWMPRTEQARPLRRLQQEMQMLLYTHAVNDERVRRGVPPVNSFWVSGTGALPAGHRTSPPAGLRITHDLRDAALREDWPAWARVWQDIDERECAPLAALLDERRAVSITLCGERTARTWSSAPRGWLARVKGLVGRKPAAQWLEAL